jgi:alpha-mannosidase
VQRHPEYTHGRLAQLAERMKRLVYSDVRPVEKLLVSEQTDRITHDAAQKLNYREARIGEQFGPLWATYWFRGEVRVPESWRGSRVDLLWDSNSEATHWLDGRIAQGLNHEPMSLHGRVAPDGRPDAVLLPTARGGEVVPFEVEMACNRMFGEGYLQTPEHLVRSFALERCDIAQFDGEAWKLYFDFWILQQLAAEDSKDLDKTWAGLLLRELNRFANLFDPADRTTWPAAAAILRPLYEHRNATTVHELSAIGHAHIDSAWLWPLAETKRKCERTFSSQLSYMDEYPEFKFVCSQAQQYVWIKERQPDLWRRICEKVKAGQWVPAGGTWIEPDCNIPSGESLSRQFLQGQRFYRSEFGVTCREFWNPDVFGYNGQLPQICRLAGIKWFLTDKLSWNRMNKPAHHTFIWEGIDGTELFTHFPPAQTYTAVVSVAQLRENARNYKDHDRSRESYLLFGHGDGGGGPTKAMLETLRRAKDLEGVPRTTIRTPTEFFERLEKDNVDRARIVGELYFECHRGTYTSQAAVKRGNRKCEVLLHDLEFLASAASLENASYTYPAAELQRLWQTVLLNQFHDILPGSSIAKVYQDAARDYAIVAKEGTTLRADATRALVGEHRGGNTAVINTLGFSRREVIGLPSGRLVIAEAPPYGIGRIVEHYSTGAKPESAATAVTLADGSIILENIHLRATLSNDGGLRSLIEKSTGREALPGVGNQLLLYVDEPLAWDAWDVDPQHLETEIACPAAESCQIVEPGSPFRAEVVFERKIGLHSRMQQTVRLDAEAQRLEFHCDCDWHESHKMLKVAFPVNVRAMNATYETQFGCVERPTHFNTSYDLARYEVPGHKWLDLSEHGFGVSLLSESKYGYCTFGNVMRLSLLRSPKHPDPQADMGRHQFAFAVMPHAGNWREAGVVAEAYRFNVPLILATDVSCSHTGRSFASIDNPNLVLDTIKRAEEGNAIVMRLYECHGARGTARLRIGWQYQRAAYCNLLEDELAVADLRGDVIEFCYTPYQIISLKIF